ncbi:MAG: hypothetical protein GY862_28190 [Gammaproteobacteria bacterium]|nr:hypothetical protein [Gammaproteobacteria bacterium]
MEITNKLCLPDSIARAVMNDPYTNGGADISVTSLIGPARKRRLEIDHVNELSVDVADRLWSLYGQIVHGILERADIGEDEIITERRLFIERHGWNLSGQFDRLVLKSSTVLQDYKFTSVYQIADGVKPEHEAQANIYKLMLEEHGYQVDGMEIVAVLRDWSKPRAVNDNGYPQKPVVVLDVPVWPGEKIETFITERLMVHGQAQTELPVCTSEERWERNSVWKVKKDGNKTAVRGNAAHPDEISAQLAATDLEATTGKKHNIEFHQGNSIRCAMYCEASPFCDFWQKINPNKLGL